MYDLGTNPEDARMPRPNSPPPKPGDMIELERSLGVVSHIEGVRCFYWPATLEAGNRVRVSRTELKSINARLCLVVPRPDELAKRVKAARERSLARVPERPNRDGVPGIKRISKKFGKNGRWILWSH